MLAGKSKRRGSMQGIVDLGLALGLVVALAIVFTIDRGRPVESAASKQAAALEQVETPADEPTQPVKTLRLGVTVGPNRQTYDDVGRLCRWGDLYPLADLSRSRYERVVGNAIARRSVRIDGAWHRPVGMRGWTHIVLRRESDGVRRIHSLDDLLALLDVWDHAQRSAAP